MHRRILGAIRWCQSTVEEQDGGANKVIVVPAAYCNNSQCWEGSMTVDISEVDGRIFGDGKRGTVTERLQKLYADLIKKECPE